MSRSSFVRRRPASSDFARVARDAPGPAARLSPRPPGGQGARLRRGRHVGACLPALAGAVETVRFEPARCGRRRSRSALRDRSRGGSRPGRRPVPRGAPPDGGPAQVTRGGGPQPPRPQPGGVDVVRRGRRPGLPRPRPGGGGPGWPGWAVVEERASRRPMRSSGRSPGVRRFRATPLRSGAHRAATACRVPRRSPATARASFVERGARSSQNLPVTRPGSSAAASHTIVSAPCSGERRIGPSSVRNPGSPVSSPGVSAHPGCIACTATRWPRRRLPHSSASRPRLFRARVQDQAGIVLGAHLELVELERLGVHAPACDPDDPCPAAGVALKSGRSSFVSRNGPRMYIVANVIS